VLTEQGFANAWVLQVATVSSSARAEAVTTTLGDKGYKAFVRPIERNGETLFRVQVGPKVEREKLEAIKSEVDRLLSVESAILRYVQ
jgi:DedD protein